MDILESLPGSCRETCITPSHEVNEVMDIKVEDVSDIQDNTVPISFPPIKTEHEVSSTYVHIVRNISQKYRIAFVLNMAWKVYF